MRLKAGGLFAAGEKTAVIAKELRVIVRSVQRQRRAWREGGLGHRLRRTVAPWRRPPLQPGTRTRCSLVRSRISTDLGTRGANGLPGRVIFGGPVREGRASW
ncbi:hypothetical protein ACIO3M_39520 [Streptomyces erythrochromogenes]|uniref:hypothetical protein n=1 Tax=Streptomyces erythrochromogenes TaxID=285574 RepID=UPI0038247BD1